jgi:hypothetical protein
LIVCCEQGAEYKTLALLGGIYILSPPATSRWGGLTSAKIPSPAPQAFSRRQVFNMKSPILIGLVWFLLFAILPAVAAGSAHLNYWFIGWLVIDAVSSFVIARAVVLAPDRAAPSNGLSGAKPAS